jgi:hypothetical protein
VIGRIDARMRERARRLEALRETAG